MCFGRQNWKSVRKTRFCEIIDGGNVFLFPLVGELCINAHDHGCVRVAHPFLEGLDRNTGVITHGAERDPEIMAFYVYCVPGRKRFSFIY